MTKSREARAEPPMAEPRWMGEARMYAPSAHLKRRVRVRARAGVRVIRARARARVRVRSSVPAYGR